MGGSSSTRTEGSADSPAKSAAIHPGMNANGEVIDATKVESGHGQKVKGINDYEGEITGIAAPNSRFTQLKIGMGFKQVMDIADRQQIRAHILPAKPLFLSISAAIERGLNCV